MSSQDPIDRSSAGRFLRDHPSNEAYLQPFIYCQYLYMQLDIDTVGAVRQARTIWWTRAAFAVAAATREGMSNIDTGRAGTRQLIRALQQAMNETLDRLCDLMDGDLERACSHPCGGGPGDSSSIWHLLANDIDHEKMHAAQLLNARHDMRLMQTGSERLLAEWLKERAALMGALVGLPDEVLDRRLREGEWSYREMVQHVLYWEADSIEAGLNDIRGAARWRPDPALDFSGAVPGPRSPSTAPEGGSDGGHG